jgi:hypothetical protein
VDIINTLAAAQLAGRLKKAELKRYRIKDQIENP